MGPPTFFGPLTPVELVQDVFFVLGGLMCRLRLGPQIHFLTVEHCEGRAPLPGIAEVRRTATNHLPEAVVAAVHSLVNVSGLARLLELAVHGMNVSGQTPDLPHDIDAKESVPPTPQAVQGKRIWPHFPPEAETLQCARNVRKVFSLGPQVRSSGTDTRPIRRLDWCRVNRRA